MAELEKNSDISIANRAMLSIGGSNISSFKQEILESEIANAMYGTTLEAFLTKHRWGFAIAQAELSRLTAKPLHTWEYIYQLPSDKPFIMLDRVYPNMDYQRIQDNIYTNASSVTIDYRFKPDASAFPAYFVTALEFELASVFAYPLTRNESLAQLKAAQANDWLVTAKLIDSQEYPTVAIQDAPFIDVR